MNDKQLRQAIDACRPGNQDLNQAELVELAERMAESLELRSSFDRVQSADRVLAQALDDVPVPANLADRLLARLQAAAPQQGTPQPAAAISAAVCAAPTSADANTEAATTAAKTTSRSASSQRWRVGLTAVAASLLAVIGWRLIPNTQISAESMPEMVASVYDQLGGDWQNLQTAPPSLASPKVLVRPRDWQDVSGAFGRKAVAYRFALGGGSQAVLFAVNVKLDRVPSIPPTRPQPTTGARSIAIWQSGDVAYVLVISGSGRDYQRLFKSQPGATA